MASVEESRARYEAALHAVQSGVMYKMQYAGAETDPKYLRVGINSAMVETSAIISLLIEKGVITHEEFYERLADMMEGEKRTYEEWLTQYFGGTRKIELH